MRPRHAKIRDKRDSNHGEIVWFLRQHGIEVIETERPLDCLIWNDKRAGWMEIKTPTTYTQRSQVEFMSETDMPVAIVRSEGEALIFAETMEGLSQKQKDALAGLLLHYPGAKTFTPVQIEKALL